MSGKHEKAFMGALSALFIGAKVEGDSGFVNLMQIKEQHFHAVRDSLSEKIQQVAPEGDPFREELFDKLHHFFSRHFCEGSGSVYFRDLRAADRVYDRVFADGRDVALAWKTRNLFYVKSDRVIQSIPVEFTNDRGITCRFFFNAEKTESRRANERREFVFTLAGVTSTSDGQPRAEFSVEYSEKARTTKIPDILAQLKESGGQTAAYREEDLQRAFSVFRRQSETDFFIHQNAGEFLREQLHLWTARYLFTDKTKFTEKRVRQLKGLREVADDIIEFIAQFEDELARVWRKPKFVLRANYVATLDRLQTALPRILKCAKGVKAQTAEWRELELVPDGFNMRDLLKSLPPQFRFLPLDTRHFKEAEGEILNALGDLDSALDGELIRGDNWQALNTIREKYKGKVKYIYIDPPFNLASSDQFDYRTNYKDACWATMLENRLTLARDFLADDGGIFVRCGHDGNYLVRFLLNTIFGIENYRNEIVVRRAEEQKGELMKQFATMRAMMVNYDNLYWYSANPDVRFPFITKPTTDKQSKSHWHTFWKAEDRRHLRYELLGVDLSQDQNGQWMWKRERALRAVENYRRYLDECGEDVPLDEYWRKTGMELEFICRMGRGGKSSVKYWVSPREFVISDNNWMDIKGYANMTAFKTENSESLLARIISHLLPKGSLCMDFFAGSGTTLAVAQKLGRKWVGVEMGAHFDTVILPRMKKVLSGAQSGISGETEYAGGGAFMYCEMEQYEDTLRGMSYKGSSPVLVDGRRGIGGQYVFLSDEKLSGVASLSGGDLSLDLGRLPSGFSLAETLANARGSFLRKFDGGRAILSDGSEWKLNAGEMTEEEKTDFLRVLRPYLWWGE